MSMSSSSSELSPADVSAREGRADEGWYEETLDDAALVDRGMPPKCIEYSTELMCGVVGRSAM